MTEVDKYWLGGIMDGRGQITVSKGSNVIGSVRISCSDDIMAGTITSCIIDADIQCGTPLRIGNTYVLNFTATRGTRLLSLLYPYMRNTTLLRRAEAYTLVFPEESEGKHMKLDRMEKYIEWLKVVQMEKENDLYKAVKEKIV